MYINYNTYIDYKNNIKSYKMKTDTLSGVWFRYKKKICYLRQSESLKDNVDPELALYVKVYLRILRQIESKNPLQSSNLTQNQNNSD